MSNTLRTRGDSRKSAFGEAGTTPLKHVSGGHRKVIVRAVLIALTCPLPAVAIDLRKPRVPMVAPGNPTDPVTKRVFDPVALMAQNTDGYFKMNGANDGLDDAEARGERSLAVGSNALAAGTESMAMGWNNAAYGTHAVAIGAHNQAIGASIAIGIENRGFGDGSIAFGLSNVVLSEHGNAFGSGNYVEGGDATVLGNGSTASAKNSLVLGNNAMVSAEDSVAIGTGSVADIANTVSVGSDTQQRRIVQVADGSNPTDAVNKSQLDNVANAANTAANTANGTNRYFKSKGKGDGSDDATASAEGSVAIGAGALADVANTVSMGSNTQQRRIMHVAAGTDATDAVNLSQLNSMAAGSRVELDAFALALGGGANVTFAGVFSPPGYLVQGTQYQNVGAALNALDGALSGAWTSIRTLQNPAWGARNFGPFVAIDGKGDGSDTASVKADSKGVAMGAGAKAGDHYGTAVGGDSYAAGPNDTAVGGGAKVNADGSTAVGSNAVVGSSAANAVAIGADASVSSAGGTAVGQGASVSASEAVALGQGAVADRANTVSVGNARQQRQITNVAAGVQDTDAANTAQVQAALQTAKTYADAGDRSTLNQSMAYTDKKTADFASRSELGSLRSEVNDQFGKVNTRIDRIGAMNAASTQMAINAAGATGNGRIAAGVGLQGGRSAISVGYATPLSTKMRVSVGVTASGSEASAGVGFGVDL